jgi:hypothetical protein
MRAKLSYEMCIAVDELAVRVALGYASHPDSRVAGHGIPAA